MKNKNVEISQIDIEHLLAIRNNVKNFIKQLAEGFDRKGLKVLDVAPQVHAGALEFFKKAQVDTLDIDPNTSATYIADLCKNNSTIIKDNFYDLVICTEVLEHTLQPFDATKEIHRILKARGVAAITTPFNFRIHGPLPDCWRFSEHGLKELFKQFHSCEIRPLETIDRDLFPVHYTTLAIK